MRDHNHRIIALIMVVTSLLTTACGQQTEQPASDVTQAVSSENVFPPEHHYFIPKKTENLTKSSDSKDNESVSGSKSADTIVQQEDNDYLNAEVAIRYVDTSNPEIQLDGGNIAHAKWYTTDATIATVDDHGLVTTKDREGITRIIATNGMQQASCYVAVVTNQLHIATPDESAPYYGYYQEGEYNLIGCNQDYVRRELESDPFSTTLCNLVLVRVSGKNLPKINEDQISKEQRKENNPEASFDIGSASAGSSAGSENLDINGNPVIAVTQADNSGDHDEADQDEKLEDQKKSDGNLTIDITTSLVYYVGDVDLPSNLTYKGKNYNITEIDGEPYTPDDFWFDDRYGGRPFAIESKLQNLTIPETVTKIRGNSDSFTNQYDYISNNGHTSQGNAFAGFTKLKSLTVKGDNYVVKDGVLFTKDMKTLLYYPAGSLRDKYQVPDSVTTIGDYAFYGAADLKVVGGGSNVSNVGKDAFMNMRSLQDLQIKTDDITVKDGLMLMDSGHYLSSIMKKDGEVVIPKSVTSMAANIFDGLNGTEKLTIDYNQTDGIFSDQITKISNSSTISELEINGNLDYLEVDNLSNLQKVIVNGSIGLGWIENWDSDNGIVLEINGKVSDLHVAKLDKAIYKGKEYTVDQINDLNGAMGSDSGVSIN